MAPTLSTHGLAAIVADDHELCRFGLSEILKRDLKFEDVRNAASIPEAVELLSRPPPASLALFELTLRGMNRGASLHSMREAFPNLRIAVIADTSNREDILAALSVGLHGYVPKDLPIPDIIHALKLIARGEVFVPARMAEFALAASPSVVPSLSVFPSASNIPALTHRQHDVLSLLAKGMSNKEIAKALDVSPGTVKVHTNAIFRVLGVHNRAGATAVASSLSALRAVSVPALHPLRRLTG